MLQYIAYTDVQGRDPEEDIPGFAMYVDTESYIKAFNDLSTNWSALEISNVTKGGGWVVYEWFIKK